MKFRFRYETTFYFDLPLCSIDSSIATVSVHLSNMYRWSGEAGVPDIVLLKVRESVDEDRSSKQFPQWTKAMFRWHIARRRCPPTRTGGARVERWQQWRSARHFHLMRKLISLWFTIKITTQIRNTWWVERDSVLQARCSLSSWVGAVRFVPSQKASDHVSIHEITHRLRCTAHVFPPYVSTCVMNLTSVRR